MTGDGLLIVGAALALALIVGVVVVAVSRRSHLRSWRFGVFYEAEDRYDVTDSADPDAET